MPPADVSMSCTEPYLIKITHVYTMCSYTKWLSCLFLPLRQLLTGDEHTCSCIMSRLYSCLSHGKCTGFLVMAETECYGCRYTFTSTLTTWLRDSSIGIATRLGARRSGDRIRVRTRFSTPVRPALEPNETHVQWLPGVSPGGKAAGAWRWPPTLGG